MTDLIAELADVFLRDSEGATERELGVMALIFLRNNHATLTRIIESEAKLGADYEALVIRLGEVTEKLEAAKRDAERYRWLRDSRRLCEGTETGGIYIGIAGDEFWGIAGEKADETIDADMRDSAREGGNG